MKFISKVTDKSLSIPAAAVKVSGFAHGDPVELHAQDQALVLLKQQMTAAELIRAVDGLHKLTMELIVHLAKVCGPCDGCNGQCPFGDFEYDDITLPDDLREEAGIPAGAKLCAYVDEEENTVTIAEAGYDHDLRDVPEDLLEVLESLGICMGELEEHLMVGDLVYGGCCRGRKGQEDE